MAEQNNPNPNEPKKTMNERGELIDVNAGAQPEPKPEKTLMEMAAQSEGRDLEQAARREKSQRDNEARESSTEGARTSTRPQPNLGQKDAAKKK